MMLENANIRMYTIEKEPERDDDFGKEALWKLLPGI